MWTGYLTVAWIALQLVGCSWAVNILALMGMTSHSHHLWNSVLLHELAERGHNLTILSVDMPKPNDFVPANVSYIHLERAYDFYKDDVDKIDIKTLIQATHLSTIVPFYDFGLKTAKFIAASEGFQRLLDYPDDFKVDLIINDYTLGPYLLGFAHKFNNPPIMGISAFHNPVITMDFMANSYFPALTPHHSSTYDPHMTFLQRCHNALIYAADTIYRRWYYNDQLDAIMRPFFSENMPHLTKLARRTVISLVNSHPAIDYVEAMPPNVIEVGGMQIRPAKPLSPQLDAFMRAGKRGAVLFSLGTNMQAVDVGVDTVGIILKAFTLLPQYNFLWKFDAAFLAATNSVVPKNVMVQGFLPQRDILAHESLRLFVSHCGGLSTQEATWHGVPLVGIPLFLDQHRNLRQSMNAGVAVKLDYLSLSPEKLAAAIQEVAENEAIAQAMQVRSARFRDNPIAPLDLAVWWVEYLLRHPEPSHLHSPAKHLNYFQAHSLDTLALLVVIIFAARQFLCGGKRSRRKRMREKYD